MDLNSLKTTIEEESIEVERLIRENAGLNPLTAFIMAQDICAGKRVDLLFRDGKMDFNRACFLIGSYARFDFAVRWYKDGLIEADLFFQELPELWVGSDPDDTNLEYYAIWMEARKRNGNQPVCDGSPLPVGRYNVYRGQLENQMIGFAWSLDYEVARRFAKGAGSRVPQDGVVYKAEIDASMPLAYLTARNENEVIVGLDLVQNLKNMGKV